jgi:hypothetical protein
LISVCFDVGNQTGFHIRQVLFEFRIKWHRDPLAAGKSRRHDQICRADAALPTSITGAQYEFGLRQIAAEKYVPAAPGIFVSGPFKMDGMPEVIQLDMEFTGAVECHLICRPNGDPNGDYVVQQLVSGTAISFPDTWPGDHLNTADLFLQGIFRSNDAVLTGSCCKSPKGCMHYLS